ncbi:MAG: gamma carbonic anhydrase family protein [Spirochaetes bacterium]|nr:gamma carbonic anhydrase family protein [Spirochaetota bacterium]
MLYEFDGREPKIGKDSYVSETAILVGDVIIGDNCYIGHGAILRGDYGTIKIGSGTAVEEGAVMHAPPDSISNIGERVTIGHGAVIHCEDIGNNSVIGMGAILSIQSKVGAWSIVAEGCVVKARQEIPDNVVAAGNPAKIVRKLKKKDQDFWTYGKELYINLAKKYLKIGMNRIK